LVREIRRFGVSALNRLFFGKTMKNNQFETIRRCAADIFSEEGLRKTQDAEHELFNKGDGNEI